MVGVFWCGLVGVVCPRGVGVFLVCLRGGGFGCESVVVVSDAHVSSLFLFSWFCLLSCFVLFG